MRAGGLRASTLLAAMLGLLAIHTGLLLHFFGQPLWLAIAAGLVGGAVVAGGLRGAGRGGPDTTTRVGWPTLGICFALALGLLVLGGEGRLFYAPEDWQVRDAVLADLGRNPWPVVYRMPDGDMLLRAPLGMYLLPALVGGASQIGRDLALLASNAALLGLVLALGATLFSGARARLIAGTVFVLFSGLDSVGTVLAGLAGGTADWSHLERWADTLQYTAHLTQLFWVPQHALAGWIVAAAFLLWRRGAIPIAGLAMAVPLVALWSPFAVMGALPFAALAGVQALLRRAVRWSDVVAPALIVALCLPALIYLRAGSDAIATGLRAHEPAAYAVAMLLEVIPFAVLLLATRTHAGLGAPSIWLALGLLFVLPFGQIGPGPDFQMRVSIPALAIVAVAVADWIVRVVESPALRPATPRLAMLLIAAVAACLTPAVEAFRAVRLQPSPVPDCTLPEVWTRQTLSVAPISSYLARPEAMPGWLLKLPPETVSLRTEVTCWGAKPWITPRW